MMVMHLNLFLFDRVDSIWSAVEGTRLKHRSRYVSGVWPCLCANAFGKTFLLDCLIFSQLPMLVVQFKQAEDTANKLDLDGLVVIGGDDSNTNACLLGEYFRLAANTMFWCFNIRLTCEYNNVLIVSFSAYSQTNQDYDFKLWTLLHRSRNMKTRVIGCPKTIDGDLKCKEVPTSFGFDTACKVPNSWSLCSSHSIMHANLSLDF